jgi:hypothetical protein
MEHDHRMATMKYMIMMFGDQEGMMEAHDMDWVKEMVQFMGQVYTDLSESGELVLAEGLADPTQAKVVDYRNDEVIVTDGPFAESKESLAGFWIVDVENEARALEITKPIVAYIQGPIEVREVPAGPPPEYVV